MLSSKRTLQAKGVQAQVIAQIPIALPHSLMHCVQLAFEWSAPHP